MCPVCDRWKKRLKEDPVQSRKFLARLYQAHLEKDHPDVFIVIAGPRNGLWPGCQVVMIDPNVSCPA